MVWGGTRFVNTWRLEVVVLTTGMFSADCSGYGCRRLSPRRQLRPSSSQVSPPSGLSPDTHESFKAHGSTGLADPRNPADRRGDDSYSLKCSSTGVGAGVAG